MPQQPEQLDLSGLDAPSGDQVEVTVIGTGAGECIVLHVGQGQWVIVDSCWNRREQRPYALQYLEAIGVDCSKVSCIIATHWHADHVKGIAQVVDNCSDAKVVISGAVSSDEFFSLVAQEEDGLQIGSTGVEEAAGLLAALRRRSQHPVFAKASTLVWRGTNGTGSSITALSPSDADMIAAMATIRSMLPQPGQPKKRVVVPDHNSYSVALWVEAMGQTLLLGADVERTNSPSTGWNAIVSSGTRPSGAANVFKIPHHGSENAHHDDVWSNMLASDVKSVASTYARSRLPKDSDKQRIISLSQDATITSIHGGRQVDRPSTVQKMVRLSAKSLRPAETHHGAIRLRASATESDWSIASIGAGGPMSEHRW